MKIFFRKTIAFFLMFPAVMWTHLMALFVGKEKAAHLCGPYFTFATIPFARYLAPRIQSAADFAQILPDMQKKYWLWKLFFDFSIWQNTPDVFQLKITACPIQEIIRKLGFAELAPYVCQADWIIAEENREKWLFQREHQLATADTYCDHTYLRKSHPTPNAADPPVAVGKRGTLSQLGSGSQSPQVKPGGSADLPVGRHEIVMKNSETKNYYTIRGGPSNSIS